MASAACCTGAELHFPGRSGRPLHEAVLSGDLGQLQILLARGASVEETTSSRTPLYAAAITGNTEAARLLIDGGADIEAIAPPYNAAQCIWQPRWESPQ
jgi:ankyrin repeat protein